MDTPVCDVRGSRGRGPNAVGHSGRTQEVTLGVAIPPVAMRHRPSGSFAKNSSCTQAYPVDFGPINRPHTKRPPAKFCRATKDKKIL